MNKSDLLRELRALTQAGMKDCLDALTEAGDDLQKAVDIIKTKGKNIVSSRQGKVAAEGRVSGIYNEGGTLGTMVEVNCQTDFVANSPEFKFLTDSAAVFLAGAVVENRGFDPFQDKELISTRDDLIAKTKENIVIRRWWAEQAMSPLARVFNYTHSNSKISVLLTLTAPNVEARSDSVFIELGNDLAMQVAAMSPLGISPDMLPPDEVERQKNIFLTQIQELNKPEAAQAKILDGKLNKWYSEVCLTEQESVVVNKAQVKKVIADLGAKLGGEIKVVTMIRCQVGEGIQQQTSNLAEEVAKDDGMKTPVNLEECLDALKEMLSTEDQIAIIQMEDGPIRMHHGLGMWMRNNWELWKPESALAIYFKTLGLWHADDMSGLILDSFWHHLRNEPLDIEGQVKYYQEFWEKNK